MAAGVGQLSVEAGEGIESGKREPGDDTISSVAQAVLLESIETE